MSDHADLPLETTLYDAFTTCAAATGAPTTLSGSPAVSVYENNGTTEITAGVTLSVDLDGRTGLNGLTIVASAANGYEVGKFYKIVITAGTVGGTSVVGYVVGSFSIEAGSALRPTVAGRTLDVASTGEAGLDLNNLNVPAATVPSLGLVAAGTLSGTHSTTTADLGANAPSYDISGCTLLIAGRPPRVVDSYNTGTGVATFSPAMASAPVDALAWALLGSAPASTAVFPGVDVTNWKGATAPAMTGDAYARLGAPAGASVSADVAAVQADTDNIQTRLPTSLVSGRIDASVGAMAANVMTAAAAAADLTTELQTGLATAAALTTAQTDLTTLIARITSARAGYLDNLSVGAVAQASTLATVAGYLDTEIAAILVIAQRIDTALELDGSVYRLTLNALELAPTGGSAPTVGQIRAEMDANSTQLALIAAAVDTEVAAILALLDTEIAAIKAKTDTIPVAPAAVGDIPTAVQTADAVLGRNIAGGSSTGRTVSSALRRLRNKVAIAAGVMTVYQEDDTTADHTAAVTTAAGSPISAIDPST